MTARICLICTLVAGCAAQPKPPTPPNVNVYAINNEGEVVPLGHQLPPSPLPEVWFVELPHETVPSAAEITELRSYGVRGISLAGRVVDDTSLARLTQQWPDLIYLDVSETGVTSLVLPKAVRFLRARETRVRDLEALRGHAIVDLDVSRTGLTDASTAALSTLPLRRLRINETAVGDETLLRLQSISGLRLLDVSDTQITDRGLEHTRGLAALSVLDVGGNAITDEGLSGIEGAVGFTGLGLRKTRITDATVAKLTTLVNLESLELSETATTDAALPALVTLQKLRRLFLSRTAVSDAGVAALLPNLGALELLHLDETRVAAETLAALPQTLTELALAGTRPGPIVTLPTLEVLDLTGVYLRDTELSFLPTSLRALFLGATHASGEPLAARLPALTELRQLDLARTAANDETAAALKTLTKLEGLGLASVRISGAALVHLRELDRLSELDVSLANLSDDDLRALTPLTALRKLNLGQTNVTDAGVNLLPTGLSELHLYHTKIKRPGVARFVDLRLLDVRGVTVDGLEVPERCKLIESAPEPADTN